MAGFLRRTLRRPRPSTSVDTQRLVAALSAARLPERLPMRNVAGWAPDAAVLIDCTDAMTPLRPDLHALQHQLRKIGRAHV